MADGVRIRIEAVDETGRTFEGVIEGLEDVDRSGRSVRATNEATNRSFREGSEILGRSMQVMTRLDLMQITLEGSTERVRAARAKYHEVLARDGPLSGEAASAARNLEAAERDLEKTNLRLAASYATLGLAAVESAGKAYTAAGGFSGIRSEVSGLEQELGKIPILGGLALGALALLGSHAAMRQLKQQASEVNVELAQLTPDQRLERARRALVEFQRLPEGVRKSGEALGFGTTLEQQLYQEYLTAAQAATAARGSLLEQAGTQVAELQKATDKSLNEIREAERSQRLHAVQRTIDDAVKAGDVGALRSMQEGLAAQLFDGSLIGTSAYDELNEALGRVNSALNSLSTDGGRNALDTVKEAEKALADFQARARDMGEIGVSLAAFSPKFRAEMDALAKSIHAVGGSEEDFNEAALKSSKALRDQTEITAYKDETTQDFQKRLRELGFTEQEIALRIDESGRALRRQTDATKAAAEATQHRIGGASNPLLRSILTPGLLGDDTAHALFAFLDANPDRWRDPRLGGVLGVLESASRGASYHPGTIARMLQGIVSADSGFHGMLDQDTLFLAHRGERVDIDRPSRMPSGGLNVGTVVVHVHGAGGSPGTIEREVARGVRQGLASARGRA